MADTIRLAAEAIRSDLRSADEQFKWALASAWWPSTTPSDAPSPPQDGDGPPWATGQPGDQVRHRLRQSIRRLCTLEGALSHAIVSMHRRDLVELVAPTAYAPLADLRRTLILCGVRTDVLHSRSHFATPVTRRHMEHACRTSQAMRGLLDSALGPTAVHPSGKGPAVCWVCKFRTATTKAAGRCSTCKSWRDRHGEERPRHLDGEHVASIAEARAASARARRRGEGWGAA